MAAIPARGVMMFPSRAFKRKPGREWHRIKISRPDGSTVDANEARLLLPENIHVIAKHIGQGGGMHVFEFDPAKVRR